MLIALSILYLSSWIFSLIECRGMTNYKRAQLELWDTKDVKERKVLSKETQVFVFTAGRTGVIFLTSELAFLLSLGAQQGDHLGAVTAGPAAQPASSRTRLWAAARHLCEGTWALLVSAPRLPALHVPAFSRESVGWFIVQVFWGGSEDPL